MEKKKKKPKTASRSLLEQLEDPKYKVFLLIRKNNACVMESHQADARGRWKKKYAGELERYSAMSELNSLFGTDLVSTGTGPGAGDMGPQEYVSIETFLDGSCKVTRYVGGGLLTRKSYGDAEQALKALRGSFNIPERPNPWQLRFQSLSAAYADLLQELGKSPADLYSLLRVGLIQTEDIKQFFEHRIAAFKRTLEAAGKEEPDAM